MRLTRLVIGAGLLIVGGSVSFRSGLINNYYGLIFAMGLCVTGLAIINTGRRK